MSENIINDDLVYREPAKVIERKNDFCVVALETRGEYNVRDIQTSKSWSKNPYPDTYAVVPDEMVQDILATRGFFDITVEDGVVTGFTAREIPDIPEPEPTPEPTGDTATWDDMAAAIEEGVNDV